MDEAAQEILKQELPLQIPKSDNETAATVQRQSEPQIVEKAAAGKLAKKITSAKACAQKTPPMDSKVDSSEKNDKASPNKGCMPEKSVVKLTEPEPAAPEVVPKQHNVQTVRKYADSGKEEGECAKDELYEDDVCGPKIETDDYENKQTNSNKGKKQKSLEKQLATKGGQRAPCVSKATVEQSELDCDSKTDLPAVKLTPSKVYIKSHVTDETPEVAEVSESENESDPLQVYEIEEQASEVKPEAKDTASMDATQLQDDTDSIWSGEVVVPCSVEAEAYPREEPLEADSDFVGGAEEELRMLPKAKTSVVIDVDAFPDLLTGELIVDEQTKQVLIAKKKNQKEEYAAKEAKAKEFSASKKERDAENLQLDEDVNLFFPPKEKIYDTQRFLSKEFDYLTQKKVKLDNENDCESESKEEQLKDLEKISKKFIDTLIARAVLMSEHIDSKESLRQSLNKEILMEEIIQTANELLVEKTMLGFLNSKVVDCFKRKHLFEAFDKEDPALEPIAKRNFRESLHALDKVLKKEEQTRKYIEEQEIALEKQLKEAEDAYAAELEEFNALVYNTLKRDNSEDYNERIKKHLSGLNNLHQKVSAMRQTLINQQHTWTNVVEDIEQKPQESIEDLGDGLKMQDNERLQIETTTLAKQIEERNFELNELRATASSYLDEISDSDEEQQGMMETTESLTKEALQELMEKEADLRQKLFNIMVEHDGMSKLEESQMNDYEETVKAVERTRANVEYLKQQCEAIEAELSISDEMEDEDK